MPGKQIDLTNHSRKLSRLSFINDRYTQGFVAGMIGWLPQMLFSQTMFWLLHWTRFQFLDFAALASFSHKPHGAAQFIFAELIVLSMQGMLGVLFAVLIKQIYSPNMLLKGGFYGSILWVIIYSIFTIFKMKGIYGIINFPTAVLHLMASAIWGTAMAAGFLWLNCKFELRN